MILLRCFPQNLPPPPPPYTILTSALSTLGKRFIIGLSDPSVYPIYQLFGSTSIHLETEADSSGTQQHEPSSADTEHRYPPLHGTSLMGFINPLWKQKWVSLLLLLTIALSLCRKTFSSSYHLPSSRHLPRDTFRISNFIFKISSIRYQGAPCKEITMKLFNPPRTSEIFMLVFQTSMLVHTHFYSSI